MNLELQIPDCVGPRAEYFIGGVRSVPVPTVGEPCMDLGTGGIAVYITTKRAAPEPVNWQRVFAAHRRRAELMLLASFCLN